MLISNQKALALLEAIGNNNSLGITIIDDRGVVVFRNRGHEEISGISNLDVLGKHFSTINGNAELLDVLKTGVPQLGLPYETSWGTKAIVHRFPLRDNNNKIIGAMSITVFNDISEVRKLLLKYKALENKVNYYEKEIQRLRGAKYSFKNIVGKSESINSVIKLAKKYAITNSPILITGESGTGKELFAHAIHMASPRKTGPFIVVNCPSIPKELLESELFGYEPGAFSGAKKDGKCGKFEMANGGTIFLDEISSLDLNLQPKLLRVLQDHRIERVGGNKPIELDFRVISATNRDLSELVKQGLFREDLFYRLSVLTLNIPPLRERKEDIPELVDYFLSSFKEETKIAVDEISKEVLRCFDTWTWPGNVRELKNVVEQAAISSETKRIELKDLPAYLIAGSVAERRKKNPCKTNLLKQSKQSVERSLLEATLKKNNWNKSKTARQLGISRPLLYSLIKKYKINKKL